jgi:hypothetical protein
MEDYDAFAAALGSGISELRGCLIASSDGRALGVYPEGGATDVEDAWQRLAELRESDSAFIQFGPETWCSVRRGSHIAFAVIGPSADPGTVSEHMEQVLIAAEKTRAAHRTSPVDLPSPPGSSADAADDDDHDDDDYHDDDDEEEEEIDRISLVSEFSRLLQDHGDAADG